jgi:hypothetical protein
MTKQELIEKINILPEELQKEVIDFIEFLTNKYNVQSEKAPNKKTKSNYGNAKGLIVMSKDFDEPLDDFKDYM